jgi:hypothetical protein
LNGTFAALANDDAAANADRSTSVERVQGRFTRTRNDFLLDNRRDSVHELLHDFLKIRTSSHFISPFMAGAD